MKKDIEVEVRGLLNTEQYQKALAILTEKGVSKESKHRVLIDYSTFLPGQGIRERSKDIRVRVTNGIPEITVKLGSWGGSESRKELSFKGKEGEFETLVEIFGNLGFTKGVLAERRTKVFDYKDVEFALVEVPNHSFYFEAEKMAHGEEDFAHVEQEIRGICDELGLTVVDKEGFFAYIDILNKEANGVFDFSEYQTGYFAKKFGI